jgi:hypothetical protein
VWERRLEMPARSQHDRQRPDAVWLFWLEVYCPRRVLDGFVMLLELRETQSQQCARRAVLLVLLDQPPQMVLGLTKAPVLEVVEDLASNVVVHGRVSVV